MPRHGGVLAIAAGSYGMEFEASDVTRPFETAGQVAIVDIRGPLVQHTDWLWDSYDSIANRVSAAFASACTAVILRMDSPGGDALGVFEAARELRALAVAARKPLIAYADGMIASAAYALACATDAIYVPPAGFVGSIGIIKPLVDTTAMDRAMGLNFAVIASGARKTDGNPHVAISEGAIAETQAQVDSLAELFFELVSEMRGVSADDVRALQAGMFHGEKAVSAKLADGVATFNELLAMVAGGNAKALSAGSESAMNYKELRAALAKMAEGEGEDADKAKKSLAAIDESEKPAEEPKKDPPKEEPKAAEEPKKDEPKAAEEPKKDEPAANLAAMVHSLEAKIAERDAKIAAKEEAEHRAKLLATRPDFSATVKSTLMKGPLATLEDAVKNWERGPVLHPAAAAQVHGTRGQDDAGDGGARSTQLPPKEKEELDARMGLGSRAQPIRREGRSIVFGALSAEAAREHLAKSAKAAGNGGSR